MARYHTITTAAARDGILFALSRSESPDSAGRHEHWDLAAGALDSLDRFNRARHETGDLVVISMRGTTARVALVCDASAAGFASRVLGSIVRGLEA